MTWYRIKILFIVSLTIILLMAGFVKYFVFQRAPNLKLVAELIKIDINTAVKGHPFTDSQYKHIIAEDRQTSKGFRKEWLDEIEKGALSGSLASINDPETRNKVRILFEQFFRQEEELLRNMDSKEIAFKAADNFDDFMACVQHYTPDKWNAITDEVLRLGRADRLISIAHSYTDRHLHMSISGTSEITKQECDERVSK